MVERVRNTLQAPLFHSISFDFYDNFSTMCLILKRERIVLQSRGKHFTAERCLLTFTRFHVLWVCWGDSLSKLAGTRKRQHRLTTPVVWIYSYFAIINIGWTFPRLAFFKEGEMWKEAPSICRILGSGGRKTRWSRYNLILSKSCLLPSYFAKKISYSWNTGAESCPSFQNEIFLFWFRLFLFHHFIPLFLSSLFLASPFSHASLVHWTKRYWPGQAHGIHARHTPHTLPWP